MSKTELPVIVGLYSPSPQSGKSTAAQHLSRKHDYEIHSFAGPLKSMVCELLDCAGYFGEAAHAMLYGADKEKPIPELGRKTTRQLLQTLGTDWGRNMVSDSIWTDLAIKSAEESLPVAFDDMRFPNEMQAIRDAGGVCICIVRPGAQHSTAHASEGALNQEWFDAYIVNSGTVGDLYAKLDAALQEIARKRAAAESRPAVAESATANGARVLQRRSPYGDLAALFDAPAFSAAMGKPPFAITGPGEYRTRDGRVALIDERSNRCRIETWPGRFFGSDAPCFWFADGGWNLEQDESDLDIVEGPL